MDMTACIPVIVALILKQNGYHITSLMSNRGESSYQKALYPLALALVVRNEKTTYKKSWSANLLVSNLTSDPCFKVKCCHHTKSSHIYLIIAWFWGFQM